MKSMRGGRSEAKYKSFPKLEIKRSDQTKVLVDVPTQRFQHGDRYILVDVPTQESSMEIVTEIKRSDQTKVLVDVPTQRLQHRDRYRDQTLRSKESPCGCSDTTTPAWRSLQRSNTQIKRKSLWMFRHNDSSMEFVTEIKRSDQTKVLVDVPTQRLQHGDRYRDQTFRSNESPCGCSDTTTPAWRSLQRSNAQIKRKSLWMFRHNDSSMEIVTVIKRSDQTKVLVDVPTQESSMEIVTEIKRSDQTKVLVDVPTQRLQHGDRYRDQTLRSKESPCGCSDTTTPAWRSLQRSNAQIKRKCLWMFRHNDPSMEIVTEVKPSDQTKVLEDVSTQRLQHGDRYRDQTLRSNESPCGCSDTTTPAWRSLQRSNTQIKRKSLWMFRHNDSSMDIVTEIKPSNKTKVLVDVSTQECNMEIVTEIKNSSQTKVLVDVSTQRL
ncbi:hypothetical protein CHS0354_009777 [Potamilus streckersoni]|uniref:Uncharacterized protein n=1 Tax=Potamilus streckersoni TaxID=2493646 RepID=A0AAE0SW22_9BIVA|nr:hypothetical protein CHS0354_009777 [Potamilus streckersoni]